MACGSHLYFFMNFRVSSLVSFRPFASSLCFSAIIVSRAACHRIRLDQTGPCYGSELEYEWPGCGR